jgi:hypothetical protein
VFLTLLLILLLLILLLLILLLLIPLTRILSWAAKTNIDFSNVSCRMPIILLCPCRSARKLAR